MLKDLQCKYESGCPTAPVEPSIRAMALHALASRERLFYLEEEPTGTPIGEARIRYHANTITVRISAGVATLRISRIERSGVLVHLPLVLR